MIFKFSFCIFGLLSFVSSLEDMYSPGNIAGREDVTLLLKCEHGYHIDPQWAIYGTIGTECASPISLQVVRDKCYGMNTCSIEAVYTLFGDPCTGVLKRLTISYICAKSSPRFLKETKDYLHSGPLKRAKEGQYINLYCSTGYTIQTMWANYGLQDQVKCGAELSLPVVKYLCDGRVACKIQASYKIFGDPCPGTNKHLDVIHRCIRNKTVESDVLSYLPLSSLNASSAKN